MAGFRSPLFILGIAAAPVASDTGVRSLLAPWIGGASAPSAVADQGAHKSLLAFWLGGACSPAFVPPPPPTPVPQNIAVGGSGGLSGKWKQSDTYDRRGNQRAFREDRDMLEILLILAIATESCQP